MTVLDRENRGRSAARNAGVRVSHGDYVALLDADDLWLPDKVAKNFAALQSRGDAVLVYSDAQKIDEAGRPLNATCTPGSERRAPTMDDMLTTMWNLLPSAAMMTRAVFDEVGGFHEGFGKCPKWEDTWFMILARERGPFVYLDEPLVLYRVTSTVAADLERQEFWTPRAAGSHLTNIDRCIGGSELIQRLVRERFGDRAARLSAELKIAIENLLVGIGLTAMHQRDRTSARRAYVLALRHGRLNPKVCARFAWTYLPESVARALSAILPRRLHRAVSGPAHA